MRTKLKTRVNRAFTLIEILIVVVILGILAAIVIPQFTDASQQAMESSVVTQLQTLRSQIELHDIQFPLTPFDPVGNFQGWDQLTTGGTDPGNNGDYLQMEPKNPMMNGNAEIALAVGGGKGWIWADPNTWGFSIYAPAQDELGFLDLDNDGNAD